MAGPNDPDNPSASRNAPAAPARPSQPTRRPQPSQANDPDNPNAQRNQPVGVFRPGLQSGETIAAYDDWWETNELWVSEFMTLNPERDHEVKALLWQFRNSDGQTITNAFMQRGLSLGEETTSGGRGPGGGGGGARGPMPEDYASAEAAVRNRSRMLGVELDDGGIKALAKTVVDGKWSADQLDDYLVPAAVSTNNPGAITASVNQVKALAAQQLLSVSDATAREWAGRIASGEMDLAGVQSLIQAQATAKYSWAAPQIAAGMSVRDLLLPSRDRIADELEVGAETIDLMDPKWVGMMMTLDDKGNTRAATDGEVVARVRKEPQWANTRRAGQMVTGFAKTISDYFGG